MYYIYGAKGFPSERVYFYHVKREGVIETLEAEYGMSKVDDYEDVWCIPGTSKKSIEAGRQHYKIVKIPVLEELMSE